MGYVRQYMKIFIVYKTADCDEMFDMGDHKK